MERSLELDLDSPARTRELGKALGRALPHRALCLFFGELAAGKTTLIKAVCEGLGIAPEHVISPTYTLVNIYPGPLSVYHVDLFRMEDGDALLELDRADWLNPQGVTLIEWPQVALPLLTGEPCLEVHLAHAGAQAAHATARESRGLRVEDAAGAYGEVLAALRGILHGHRYC